MHGEGSVESAKGKNKVAFGKEIKKWLHRSFC